MLMPHLPLPPLLFCYAIRCHISIRYACVAVAALFRHIIASSPFNIAATAMTFDMPAATPASVAA